MITIFIEVIPEHPIFYTERFRKHLSRRYSILDIIRGFYILPFLKKIFFDISVSKYIRKIKAQYN